MIGRAARPSREGGFTLIEMMIVVAVISVLAAISIPFYNNYTAKAAYAEVLMAAGPLKTALQTCAASGECANASGFSVGGGSGTRVKLGATELPMPLNSNFPVIDTASTQVYAFATSMVTSASPPPPSCVNCPPVISITTVASPSTQVNVILVPKSNAASGIKPSDTLRLVGQLNTSNMSIQFNIHSASGCRTRQGGAIC